MAYSKIDTSLRRAGESVPKSLRTALVARLREQFSDIETEIFSKIRSVSEPSRNEDPEYLVGLRAAVVDALEYGFSGIEQGERDRSSPPPPAAAAQARRAARSGVELDTVLRRYTAGDRLLAEFILNEADHFPIHLLRQLIREQGPRLDRLMAAISVEYMDELKQIRRSSTQRLAECVECMLDNDCPPPFSDLNYEFDVWHLGIIAKGASAKGAVSVLAAELDRTRLSIPRGDEIVWAWLGGRHPLAVDDIEDILTAARWSELSLALGEPRKGLDGWRQTHYEAQMAFYVLLHHPKPVTRSRDVILDSAVLKDERLAMSLIETYLSPLDGRGTSGRVLRETLRAYFKADQNVASTALILGKARHTVERHLRKVEERLGRTLDTCNVELQVALRAEELAVSSELT